MTNPNLETFYRMIVELAADDVNVCKMARDLRDAEKTNNAAALKRVCRDIKETYKHA